jgi:hypothetical protein
MIVVAQHVTEQTDDDEGVEGGLRDQRGGVPAVGVRLERSRHVEDHRRYDEHVAQPRLVAAGA